MSAAAALVGKEFRASAALWLAIVAAMLAGLLPQRGLREFGPLFYVVGALALGANAMGHEYRYGTLAQLLTQPIARGRVLAAKMTVLAALLTGMAAVAAAVVFSPLRVQPADRAGLVALFTLPPAYGLLVAPWLTLKTRSALAGTLFSGALGGLLLTGGTWAGALRFEAAADIDFVKMQVLWTGSAVLCLCAAAGLWRSFAALQIADAVRSDIALTDLFGIRRDVSVRGRHPVLLLAGKDLRLQQLTFVAPIVYVLFCLTLAARRATLPGVEDAIIIATIIHALVIAALAGAFSCAEERALGTLEWQALQPMPARGQFAVKLAVTGGLAALLAVGLPLVMASLFGASLGKLPSLYSAVKMLAVLLSGSIYVSSVSGSALAAFVACIPAFMASYWFVQAIAARTAWEVFLRFHELPRPGLVPAVTGWPAMAVWGLLVLLLLAFAFENHRTADRSLPRTARQLLIAAGYVVAASAAFAAAGQLPIF